MERAHRRHEPDPRAGARVAARAPPARSATVRRVLIAGSPPAHDRRPASGWRRRARRTAAAGRRRGRRPRRAGVRPSARSPRATGPVSARRASERRPVLDGRAYERHEQRVGRPGRRREPLGGGLERDEEVRRDRRSGVIRGAVGLGDGRTASIPSAVASSRANRQRCRGGAGDRGAGARERAPEAVTVISGCSEKPSWGAERARAPSRPSSGRRAVPEPAGPRPRPRRSRASGTHSRTASDPEPSAPLRSGPETSIAASDSAFTSARPSRPAPITATRWGVGWLAECSSSSLRGDTGCAGQARFVVPVRPSRGDGRTRQS